ncbi:MAG: DnaJ-class molecular chaperone [Rhodospirillaceae bacterium]|nr:MAG: DnaJ-class molecular chaperone [Rhodospirillaceae bacterium]
MKNPYDILGVVHTASTDDIKRAYRRLARTWHPDSNADPRAEERFKEISVAYHLLADPALRARFDRGEIDAAGQERSARRASHRSGRRDGFGTGAPSSSFRFDFDFGTRQRDGPSFHDFSHDDVFADLFGKRQHSPAQRGADANYELSIVDVHITADTEDGRKLRLKGQGSPGNNGGPDGDAVVEIKVLPHPFFIRKGNDIMLEVPITLKEAVLGARVTVPTVDGKVRLTVPKGSSSGTILRLKGKGIATQDNPGDQLVKLKITLPETIDLQLETFVKHWRPVSEEDPRVKAGLV